MRDPAEMYDPDLLERIFAFARPHLAEPFDRYAREALDANEPEVALHLMCSVLASKNIGVRREMLDIIMQAGRQVGLCPESWEALRIAEARR